MGLSNEEISADQDITFVTPEPLSDLTCNILKALGFRIDEPYTETNNEDVLLYNTRVRPAEVTDGLL